MTSTSLDASTRRNGGHVGSPFLASQRLGLAGRIAGWAIVVGTAIVVILGVYVYSLAVQVLLNRERANLAAMVDGNASRLDLMLATTRQDVTFLARTAPVNGIVRASGYATGVQDASGQTDWKDRLADIFVALMQTRPEYFQVRFIGIADNGREIVRVDRVDGDVTRIPEARLQAKGDRPYFKAATALPPGSLYVSNVELNQEHGKIATPHQPTVRIATPVFAPAGGPFGIIIINVDAARLFASLDRSLGGRLLITNDSGDYLAHPDAGRTFGFDLGASDRLQDDYPDLAGVFAADGDGVYSGFVTAPDGKQQLATTRRVYFDPGNPTRYLALTAFAAPDNLLAGIAAERRSIAVLAIVLLVTGAVAAILMTEAITSPLRRVTEAATTVAAGDRNVDLSDLSRRSDETGDLARAFGAMTRQVVARERELTEKADELRQSNEQLAHFAYVASHDLQEPLRMVAGYLTLVSQRYRGKLDAETDEFIDFAVDGARRMKILINDLLSYASVANRPMDVATVDTDAVVAGVVDSLADRIAETGAQVVRDPLPTVRGDPAQLERVFARLVENAIKYRSAAPPRIRVAAARDGDFWLFTVTDNGMGIDPRFREQVFEIFKRLNSRADYPGTGIGLAVCKMVVERHGGRIWVEPAAGGGSVFCFTVPAVAEEAAGS